MRTEEIDFGSGDAACDELSRAEVGTRNAEVGISEQSAGHRKQNSACDEIYRIEVEK